MFRYKFITTYGAWVIQIQWMSFIWLTVKNGNSDMQFANLEEAQSYAATKGLPKHYAEQSSPRSYHHYMENGHAYGQATRAHTLAS